MPLWSCMACRRPSPHRACREQFHAALWAVTRLIADHLRMHRACVGGHRGGLAGEQFHAALGAAAGLCACDIGMHRACVGGHRGGLAGEQFHAAFGAAAGLRACDIGMHWTGISDRPGGLRHGSWVVHLRDQCQDLVRGRGQPAVQLGTLGLQFRGPAQLPEPGRGGRGRSLGHGDRREPVGPIRGCGAPGRARQATRRARPPRPAPTALARPARRTPRTQPGRCLRRPASSACRAG